ncbi:helix-turn-helix domain-containing protein [Sphingomonas sp. PB4P5]|uniref:helix-turn-helix domain-containing protein n=1 Tax=Parasphingomonas puruogangriensis TaxID=3096155 RepID=UPI002FCB87EF
MEVEFTPEWCIAMAEQEIDFEVGAGTLALDPTFDEQGSDGTQPALQDPGDESRLALGRFVSLARRRSGLTIEALAQKIDLEVGEVLSIERDPHHVPNTRTVYQLAMVFGVSQQKLMGLSGLTRPKDVRYLDEAVRYAARSESIERLSRDEQEALDGLIAVLSERSD